MICVCLLVLVGAGLSSVSCSSREVWTSSSEEAIREFESGLESRMKLYGREAKEHFERALELDPDFVVAKLQLVRYVESGDRREKLLAEIKSVDLDKLTERERFMVRYQMARMDDRYEEANAILEEFLQSEPEDPFGVERLAEDAWMRQDWTAAEAAYERLLEIDPNWVTAQNRLGYMAMAQGDFEAAEERFKAYRYVAPDQANPHDSMGEVLTVVGRYEEALAELEEAVAIRADFCASYMHMLDVLTLEGRPYAGYQVLERAEENCPDGYKERISISRCQLAFWSDYLDGDFDSPWREERRACTEQVGSRGFLIHRMASLSGRWDEAIALEEEVAKHVEEHSEGPEIESKIFQGIQGHLAGVRLLAQGDTEKAIENLRQADEFLYYWGQDQGILKLFNRLNLAFALETAGRDEEAKSVLDKVREVNPPFAEAYPEIRDGFSS
jgi:tetratricopeptide (TPR) repeat protein